MFSLKAVQVGFEFVHLARALSHRAVRLGWLSVLRAPFCGLTLNSLHALFGNNLNAAIPTVLSGWLAQDRQGVDSTLSEDEARRLRHAAAILLDDANASGAIPFPSWLSAYIGIASLLESLFPVV